MASNCQHCHQALTADQDKILLHGSCGHSLHLVCYEKCRSVGVRGCCSTEPALGDTLKARIFDPLSAQNVRQSPTGTNKTGFWGVWDQLKQWDAKIGISVEQSPAAAIGAGLSVKDLLSRGIDATTIVQASQPSDPLIGLLFKHYTAVDLKALGFTWDALTAVGLNRQNWREMWSPEDLHRDLGVSASQVLQSFGGIANLPNLELTAHEWQTLSLPDTPVAVFKRLQISPETVLAADFSLEEWHSQLGLKNVSSELGLTEEQRWQFMQNNATNSETAEHEFKFFFKDPVPHAVQRPVLPPARAAPSAVRGGAPSFRPLRPLGRRGPPRPPVQRGPPVEKQIKFRF